MTSIQLQRTIGGAVTQDLEVIYGSEDHTHSVAQIDEMHQAPVPSTTQAPKFKHIHDTLINRLSLLTDSTVVPPNFYTTIQEGTTYDAGNSHEDFLTFRATMLQVMDTIKDEVKQYLYNHMTADERTTNADFVSNPDTVNVFLGLAVTNSTGLFQFSAGKVSGIFNTRWDGPVPLSDPLKAAVKNIVRLWSVYSVASTYMDKDWIGTQNDPTNQISPAHEKWLESRSLNWWGRELHTVILKALDMTQIETVTPLRDDAGVALSTGVVVPSNQDIYIDSGLDSVKSSVDTLADNVGEIVNPLNLRYYRKDERYHIAFKVQKRTGKIKFMKYDFVNSTGYNDPMEWVEADLNDNDGRDFLKGLDLQARERALHEGHVHSAAGEENLYYMAKDFAAAFILEHTDTYGNVTAGDTNQETFHQIQRGTWDGTNATEYLITSEPVVHDLHFQVHSIVDDTFTVTTSNVMDAYIEGDNFDRTVADHWYQLANQRDSAGQPLTNGVPDGMPANDQLQICASVISRGEDEITYGLDEWSEIYVFRGRGDDEHRFNPTYTFDVQLYDHAMVGLDSPVYVHQEERVEVQHVELEFLPAEHLQAEYLSYMCMLHIPESFTDWSTLPDVDSVFNVHLIKKNNETKLYAFSKLWGGYVNGGFLDERFKYYDKKEYGTDVLATDADEEPDKLYEALPGSNNTVTSRRVINDFIGKHFQLQYASATLDKLYLYKCEMDQSFTLMTYGDTADDTEKLLRFTGMCTPA